MNMPPKVVHKVVYIGSERNYFSNISYRYKTTYPGIDFEFVEIDTSAESRGEKLFLHLARLKPVIIYIDFCSYKNEMLRLAELSSRDPLFHHVPLVGLIDTKEKAKGCLGAGIDFLYVKGGEFFDLVYAPMTIAFPNKVKKPDFANAKMSRDVELINDFRIGYIAPTYLHVEGDFYLEEGAKVYFNNEVPAKNIPSQNFVVKNRSETNLYYDFQYSYDLDFVFVDEPDLEEKHQEDALGVTDEKERLKIIKKAKENKKILIQNYQNDIVHAQKKHRDWVVDKMDLNLEKRTKLLVIDQCLRIFSLSESGDEFKKYSFRCYTNFEDSFKNVLRQRPSIIVYQLLSEVAPEDEELFAKALDHIKHPEKKFEFSSMDEKKKFTSFVEGIPAREREEMKKVGELVNAIKAESNFSPIIVLFNCYFQTSKSLQQTYLYPMIVTYQHSLNMGVVVNLAEIYEKRQEEKMSKLIKDKILMLKKKDPRKYGRLNESDFKEKKYFIKKSNSLSYGSIKTNVHMVKLSESEVVFQSEIELPMKTYRLDYPLPMSINLVPIEPGVNCLDEKGIKTYKGVIHSISETDKKSLRQVVNDVFFSPLNEKRQQEKSEFEELNKKVADEREKKNSPNEKTGDDSDTSE